MLHTPGFFTFRIALEPASYDGQRQEVVIKRVFDPRPHPWMFRQGTGVFEDELDEAITKRIVSGFVPLNFGLAPDWAALALTLDRFRVGLADPEWMERPISAPNEFLRSQKDRLAALANVEDAAVSEALTAGLANQSSKVRAWVASSCVRIGKSNARVYDTLVALLRDQDRDTPVRFHLPLA